MKNNDIITALANIEAEPTSHAGTPEWLAVQLDAAQTELAELKNKQQAGGIFAAHITPEMLADMEAERLNKIEAIGKEIVAKVARHRAAASELAEWRAAK